MKPKVSGERLAQEVLSRLVKCPICGIEKATGAFHYGKSPMPHLSSRRQVCIDCAYIVPDQIVDAKSVYLIKFQDTKGTEFYKIGITTNPNRRLKSLRTATPFDIEVEFCAKVCNAHQTEQTILDKYKNERWQGEWLLLDQKQAESIKLSLTRRMEYFDQKVKIHLTSSDK